MHDPLYRYLETEGKRVEIECLIFWILVFCSVMFAIWCKESVANSKKIELFNYFGKLGFWFW